MRTLLLSLALGGLLFAAGPDEQAVSASVDQFNEAARKGDEATLKRLLADDLTYLHSNAKMENKAECVAALVKGKPNFQHSKQTVRVYGKTAVVEANVVAHNVANGQPTQTHLTMLQVWVKQGKDWRMVARRTTRLPNT